ncbi:hypothetical protein B0T26DRAFT_450637 [Lasiosphaeria miniovina]|uniref:Uncharacterized protein n=1 Tax=Lasiosphaeria miniovina TaxID=1954250 RepID=A0AA39ZZ96_9PEZI|nr:uncharacterized protein B0T26DRAFT_450637 [Lasiosphaeria miniovina]KAK0706375.1 hypothetical protein B0T26DRAFT_450637 [Lasiosphaeria miniovina]
MDGRSTVACLLGLGSFFLSLSLSFSLFHFLLSANGGLAGGLVRFRVQDKQGQVLGRHSIFQRVCLYAEKKRVSHTMYCALLPCARVDPVMCRGCLVIRPLIPYKVVGCVFGCFLCSRRQLFWVFPETFSPVSNRISSSQNFIRGHTVSCSGNCLIFILQRLTARPPTFVPLFL